MKKLTWNDMHNLTHKEMKKKYKLDDKGLEHSVRRHLDGANTQERRTLYEEVWNHKKDK